MQPRVSVLILNYQHPSAVVRCVQALQSQTWIDQIEIVVIDNHSYDDSIGTLRNQLAPFPQIRIIETAENGGFGYGYNTGVQYARGEYVLFNNPDKIPDADAIEKLVQRMEEDANIGILAPKLLHTDGTQRYSIRRYPRVYDILSRRSVLGVVLPGHLDTYLMKDMDFQKEQLVDWVIGGCFMIRRDFFLELGGFDERFFLFFEDTDLCRRCHKAGKTVLYFPSVEVVDKKNRLSGETFWDLLLKKTGRIHISSAFKYFWKWRGNS